MTIKRSYGRMFPVLLASSDPEYAGFAKAMACPTSVPWSLVAPHADQAMMNHAEPLDALAQRGGLLPEELFLVLQDAALAPTIQENRQKAINFLCEAVQFISEAVMSMPDDAWAHDFASTLTSDQWKWVRFAAAHKDRPKLSLGDVHLTPARLQALAKLCP